MFAFWELAYMMQILVEFFVREWHHYERILTLAFIYNLFHLWRYIFFFNTFNNSRFMDYY